MSGCPLRMRYLTAGTLPYFFEAIRLKYPDYCRELPAMKPQTAQRER